MQMEVSMLVVMLVMLVSILVSHRFDMVSMFVVMLVLILMLGIFILPSNLVPGFSNGGYGAASDKVPAVSLKYAVHLKSKSSIFYFLKFNPLFMLELMNCCSLSFSSVRRENSSCFLYLYLYLFLSFSSVR